MFEIYFNLTDAISTPIAGAQAILRPLGTSGSFSSNPIITYSGNDGSASYSNVQPGIYSFSYSSAGYASQSLSSSTYINYDPTVCYLNFPSNLSSSNNGFDYIVNFLSGSNISTGSGFGTPAQLEVDLTSMTNFIKNNLNDWAQQNFGIAFVADDDRQKINLGFNNSVGPRILVVFLNEEGDGELSELTARVRRDYDIIIQRGKIQNEPLNSSLTTNNGPAKAFYRLVDECRDVIRCMIFPQPMVYNPVVYNHTRPGAEDGWLMDSYIINFSILLTLPRTQTLPPELVGNNDFIALNDPLNIFPNSTPNII